MDGYIKREYAVDAVLDVYYDTPDIDLSGEKFEAAILKIQAADVAPVRHGKWLNFYGDFSTAECSLCAELYEVSPYEHPRKEFFDAFKEFYNFCPRCGAKMDGGNDD